MSARAELRVYGEEEVRARLRRELPRWRLEEGVLCRRFRIHGWKGALLVVGAVGHLAEAAWHHPEIRAGWGWVEVRLRTHRPAGITDKDFALARRIEEVVAWRPEPPLEGPPADDPRFAYLKCDPSSS